MIVYTSGRFVFSIVFVFNEKLNCNGQRLRRGKGSYIIYLNAFLNLDPLDSTDRCDLDCWNFKKKKTFFLVWIVVANYYSNFMWIIYTHILRLILTRIYFVLLYKWIEFRLINLSNWAWEGLHNTMSGLELNQRLPRTALSVVSVCSPARWRMTNYHYRREPNQVNHAYTYLVN